MFTQCPECHAYFQITPQQLKQGEGEVRCGQCLTVFNAVQHLTETLPAPVTEDVEVYARWAAQATRVDHDTETPAATAEPDIEVEAQSAPADDALTQKTEQEEIQTEASDTENNGADDIALEAEPAAHEAETIAETASLEATPAQEAVVAEIEPEEVPPPKPQIPDALRRQIQEEKEARLRPPRTPWIIGSLILLLGLGGQAAYFMRNELAANLQLRPWLEQACELAGCEISLPRPPAHIEILGWDVRSHPSTPTALLANATLINNDPVAQPYPLLWLKFTDINGRPVAQRRFQPEEYLPQDADREAGMAPETPVVVELALLDPGKGAVNFEFQIEPLYLSRQ